MWGWCVGGRGGGRVRKRRESGPREEMKWLNRSHCLDKLPPLPSFLPPPDSLPLQPIVVSPFVLLGLAGGRLTVLVGWEETTARATAPLKTFWAGLAAAEWFVSQVSRIADWRPTLLLLFPLQQLVFLLLLVFLVLLVLFHMLLLPLPLPLPLPRGRSRSSPQHSDDVAAQPAARSRTPSSTQCTAGAPTTWTRTRHDGFNHLGL